MIKKMTVDTNKAFLDGNEFTFTVEATELGVKLLDEQGFVVGYYNDEKEARLAIPAISCNLRRGSVPASLLRVRPPHAKNNNFVRTSNRQVFNNNRQQNRGQ